VISTQKSCDLLHWEAAHEHVAQFVQLPIRPFSAGVRAQRFVVRLGPLRIEDQGADPSGERVPFGISWAAEERADFYLGHLAA
jgi:hypothetical protein